MALRSRDPPVKAFEITSFKLKAFCLRAPLAAELEAFLETLDEVFLPGFMEAFLPGFLPGFFADFLDETAWTASISPELPRRRSISRSFLRSSSLVSNSLFLTSKYWLIASCITYGNMRIATERSLHMGYYYCFFKLKCNFLLLKSDFN